MIARSRESRSENPGSDEPKKPVRRRFKLMDQGERRDSFRINRSPPAGRLWEKVMSTNKIIAELDAEQMGR